MENYGNQDKVLLAVDCIIFGYDGIELQILLVKRAMEPAKGQWSLMGGFVGPDENIYHAVERVLETYTGLKDVYLDQFKIYGDPKRDPIERTASVAYFALIDINKYKAQINDVYEAKWFPINEAPELIFDHDLMVEEAKARLRYKAAFHPILFELLPKKFTTPQLQNLYEQVYNTKIDNRNFLRKLASSGLLIKLTEKDKSSSKRGAFYYKLDNTKYKTKFQSFINFIPNPEQLVF